MIQTPSLLMSQGLLLHLTDTWKWAIDEISKLVFCLLTSGRPLTRWTIPSYYKSWKLLVYQEIYCLGWKDICQIATSLFKLMMWNQTLALSSLEYHKGQFKLFSLYVNDFPESITSGELYIFADDTTIFTVCDNIDIIFKAMQDILDQVLSWCGANRLIAHETKSGALYNYLNKDSLVHCCLWSMGETLLNLNHHVNV